MGNKVDDEVGGKDTTVILGPPVGDATHLAVRCEDGGDPEPILVNLVPESKAGPTVPLMEHVAGPVYKLSGRKGPAKVASNAYRSGWDNIFGRRQTVGQA
jgi:hypothetical protein